MAKSYHVDYITCYNFLKAENLTMADLSQTLGKEKSYISALMGHRYKMSEDTLQKLVDISGFPREKWIESNETYHHSDDPVVGEPQRTELPERSLKGFEELRNSYLNGEDEEENNMDSDIREKTVNSDKAECENKLRKIKELICESIMEDRSTVKISSLCRIIMTE